MWGSYLVHQRILVLDKQLEHAVDYCSQDQIKVVAHLVMSPLIEHTTQSHVV